MGPRALPYLTYRLGKFTWPDFHIHRATSVASVPKTCRSCLQHHAYFWDSGTRELALGVFFSDTTLELDCYCTKLNRIVIFNVISYCWAANEIRVELTDSLATENEVMAFSDEISDASNILKIHRLTSVNFWMHQKHFWLCVLEAFWIIQHLFICNSSPVFLFEADHELP